MSPIKSRKEIEVLKDIEGRRCRDYTVSVVEAYSTAYQ